MTKPRELTATQADALARYRADLRRCIDAMPGDTDHERLQHFFAHVRDVTGAGFIVEWLPCNDGQTAH